MSSRSKQVLPLPSSIILMLKWILDVVLKAGKKNGPLTQLRRLDLMKKDAKYLYQNIRICSDHFEDEMFTNSSKKTLTSDAARTLFKIPNSPPQTGQKRRLLYREENTSCSKCTCLLNKLSAIAKHFSEQLYRCLLDKLLWQCTILCTCKQKQASFYLKNMAVKSASLSTI